MIRFSLGTYLSSLYMLVGNWLPSKLALDFTLLQTGLERVDTFINNWSYTTVLPSDHYQAFVVALGHLFPNMK